MRPNCEEVRGVRIWDLEDTNLKTDAMSGHLFFSNPNLMLKNIGLLHLGTKKTIKILQNRNNVIITQTS